MVKTQTARAMMLKASMRATGKHTVYIRAWPLEIQQLIRDPVNAGKIKIEGYENCFVTTRNNRKKNKVM